MNAENEKLTRIIDRVLESRKDLTKDKLMELIKEKKQQIGAGYLTDLGALYLILNELGIKLEEYTKLSEITAEKKGVNLTAYLLSYKKYEKRTVFYIYDEYLMRGIYWGEEDVFKSIPLGSKIILKNAQVKKGNKEQLEVHLNSQSSVSTTNEVLKLEELLLKSPNAKNFIIRGIVEGPVKKVSYKKKDGSEGSGVSFFVKNITRYRAVLWDYEYEVPIEEGLTITAAPALIRKSDYGQEVSFLKPYTVILAPSIMEVYGAGENILLLDEFGNVRPSKLNSECAGSESVILKKARFQFPIFIVEECLKHNAKLNYQPLLQKVTSAEKGYVSLDFIVLSELVMRTPDKYEMMIGDDSGEGKILASSELSSKLKDFKVGEKVRALGLWSLGEGSFMANEYTYFTKV
ncbi:MAG: hypothetical protein ACP5LF_00930 [Nitrososphaeria archaeon]|nr:hypothetical protein [Conexivisphaerales archaeon]